ncbi:MAG: hypothetical protein EXS69_00690 [Candidatus Zambryskibacteria bacterium]|nr:hypothetical protein [Candidatus Zambryskibacteria bacterium]
MKRTIVITVALAVVYGAFWDNLFPNPNSKVELGTFSKVFSALSFPTNIPDFGAPAPDNRIPDQAWQTFEQYREFSRTHNLKGIKSLSYQLSDTCQDPLKTNECNTLMDNVYIFTRDLLRDDFKETYYDEKQIIMLSHYFNASVYGTSAQVVLFFTQDTGDIKLLGMKFCFQEEVSGSACVNTNPTTRDADKNGWWDEVEARFYK